MKIKVKIQYSIKLLPEFKNTKNYIIDIAETASFIPATNQTYNPSLFQLHVSESNWIYPVYM